MESILVYSWTSFTVSLICSILLLYLIYAIIVKLEKINENIGTLNKEKIAEDNKSLKKEIEDVIEDNKDLIKTLEYLNVQEDIPISTRCVINVKLKKLRY